MSIPFFFYLARPRQKERHPGEVSDDLVDQTEGLGLLGGHLHVQGALPADSRERLSGALAQDLVDPGLGPLEVLTRLGGALLATQRVERHVGARDVVDENPGVPGTATFLTRLEDDGGHRRGEPEHDAGHFTRVVRQEVVDVQSDHHVATTAGDLDRDRRRSVGLESQQCFVDVAAHGLIDVAVEYQDPLFQQSELRRIELIVRPHVWVLLPVGVGRDSNERCFLPPSYTQVGRMSRRNNKHCSALRGSVNIVDDYLIV